MRTVCEQSVSKGLAGSPAAPDGYASSAPVFNSVSAAQSRSLAPATWATSALQLAGDRRDVPVLLSQLLSATA
jgi:hypothetical protein